MQDRAVAIVAILAGSAVVLGVLTLVYLLTAAGHGSEALFGAVGVAAVAYLQSIHSKISKVDAVQQQATRTDTPPPAPGPGSEEVAP